MKKLHIHWVVIPVLVQYLFMAGSCSSHDDQVPKGIIPRDTMITLLADLHLVEARLILSGSRNIEPAHKAGFLAAALKNSGVDTTRFTRSFDFYAAHPTMFKNIYEDVVTEISRRQAEKQ